MKQELTIPFHVRNELDLSHPGLALRGGIPLPRGAVRPQDVRFAVADGAGLRIPAQVEITGFWPDGSVKWVLVSLATAVKAREIKPFQLRVEHGAGAAPGDRAIASEDADTIRVETGKIAFAVHKRRANLLAQVALTDGGRPIPVIGSASRAGLFVEIARDDPDTGARLRFEANADVAGFTAVLEKAGSQEAVIRLQGIHVSDTGRPFGNYTLRIHAQAQSARLRLVHSFIYTGDPRKEFVRAIGLWARPELGGLQSYALGGERGAGLITEHNQDPRYPIWKKAVLSQDGQRRYTIRKWVDPRGNRAVRMAEGGRSQGWGDLSGGAATLVAGIRNFWQEYPKAIEVDAENSALIAYLYSPYGEPLDLRRYSDLVYPALYESPGENPPCFDHACGARYIGKTSEMFLDFCAAPDRKESVREALFFQNPPLLTADMGWIRQTRVFGDFAVASQNLDPEATAQIRQLSDFLVHEQEDRGWYSFLDYGDEMHSYDPKRDLWRVDEGGYAWNNNEGMIIEAMWNAYLHTGDAKLFRFAEAMTRHTGDVDMFQMGPLAGCGNRHNVNHWGCLDKERRMTIPAHKRIYYFLTGDEHTRDLVKFTYDSLCATTPLHGALDIGVGGYAALFLWETTGEARYGEIVRKAGEVYCQARIAGQAFPATVEFDFRTGCGRPGAAPAQSKRPLEGFFLLYFGPMDFLVDSVELTESSEVRTALLEWVKLLELSDEELEKIQPKVVWLTERCLVTMRVLAWVYRQTADPRYRAMLEQALQARPGRFETAGGTAPWEVAAHPVYATGDTIGQMMALTVSLKNIPYGLRCQSAQEEAR